MTAIKNNPEKIINLMGVSEFLTGKKRNITGYNIEQKTVSKKYLPKINELNELVKNWMDGITQSGL
jgi:hypothetical protein